MELWGSAMAAPTHFDPHEFGYTVGCLGIDRIWGHVERLTAILAGLTYQTQIEMAPHGGVRCRCGCVVYPSPSSNTGAGAGAKRVMGQAESNSASTDQHAVCSVGTPTGEAKLDGHTWAPGVAISPAAYKRCETLVAQTRFSRLASDDNEDEGDEMESEAGITSNQPTGGFQRERTAVPGCRGKRRGKCAKVSKESKPSMYCGPDHAIELVLQELNEEQQHYADSDCVGVITPQATPESSESKPAKKGARAADVSADAHFENDDLERGVSKGFGLREPGGRMHSDVGDVVNAEMLEPDAGVPGRTYGNSSGNVYVAESSSTVTDTESQDPMVPSKEISGKNKVHDQRVQPDATQELCLLDDPTISWGDAKCSRLMAMRRTLAQQQHANGSDSAIVSEQIMRLDARLTELRTSAWK